MATTKTVLRLNSLEINEVNRALQSIADRLDKMEGWRGTPEFQADINLNSNKATNVATAVATGDAINLGQATDAIDGAAPSFFSDQYIYIRDEKASATAGGTFTSGAWRTRDLNTEVSDTGSNASLSSNQITLAAGTYRFCASTPAFHVDRHKCRLQNVTDGSTIMLGSSEYTAVTSDVTNRSFVRGRFTIASGKALELQHICQSTVATSGFGIATALDTEVYSDIEFWKEH